MDMEEAAQYNSRIERGSNLVATMSDEPGSLAASVGRFNRDLGVSNENLGSVINKSIEDKSALVIIDMQNDFCEGGSLAVPGSLEIFSFINHLRETNLFDLIITSRDWHP